MGGSIFADLPLNILGCFIMGIMTTLSSDWPAVPWLKSTHPIQGMTHVHVSLKTGLCGSLTTFASWNSQMVVMMNGSGTELGSQVVPALFGYMIGLHCGVGSFVFGTKVSSWLNRWKNPSLVRFDDGGGNVGRSGNRRRHYRRDSGGNYGRRSRRYHLRHGSHGRSSPTRKRKKKEEADCSFSEHVAKKESLLKEASSTKDIDNTVKSNVMNGNNDNSIANTSTIVNDNNGLQRTKYIIEEQAHQLSKIFYLENLPFLIVAGLFLFYILSDTLSNIAFYRFMWLSSLLTPPGAILRWKLSKLNGTIFQHSRKWKWVPYGTLMANVLGSLVSISCVATYQHVVVNGSGSYSKDGWLAVFLKAMQVGFAGSLSTVSTFVKEIVDISKKYPSHAKSCYYGIGTIVCCCLLGLSIYSPIVRSSAGSV
mmetsp:Transcript_25687/g.34074  ORF Transcript_25687/g.34074 Transcript_25687/m.34074 type:complete len:423 (+) Transcript_25687:729-1997(+)